MMDIYKILNFLCDMSSMEKMKREEYFIIYLKTESRHQMKLTNGKFQTNKNTFSYNAELYCGTL